MTATMSPTEPVSLHTAFEVLGQLVTHHEKELGFNDNAIGQVSERLMALKDEVGNIFSEATNRCASINAEASENAQERIFETAQFLINELEGRGKALRTIIGETKPGDQ